MLFSFEITGCDIGESDGGENGSYVPDFVELKRGRTLSVQERPNRSSSTVEVSQLSTERDAHSRETSVKALL